MHAFDKKKNMFAYINIIFLCGISYGTSDDT